MAVATFGAGCFWQVEQAYADLTGVLDTRVGYMGGHTDDPSYAEVCEDRTGHVEVVEVEFDADVVSFADLLEVFWSIHDPTSWDRQGADEGEAYRSVIFTHDEAQEVLAHQSREVAAEQFEDPIVTEIRPATRFWVAEDEHQGFLGPS